ncbi:rRNA maturation RNase YbeY [Candidatus Peregrinibacteria bacterium]|nr:rRNA maturation RNase YbeY [Candidatus Peregrinibacteria bacterium]MBT4056285.1 rRNA maturation RNase YbeY [Candidatus Peregrinibacteria bacterium]
MELNIFNEVKGFRVPRKRLNQVFASFLKKEMVGKGSRKEKGSATCVNLVFVGRGRMEELNKNWKGGDGATDVLSFGFEDGIGEIYVCPEVAREMGSDLVNEVLFLFAHGLLHLAGYTHETDKKYTVMMEKAEGLSQD